MTITLNLGHFWVAKGYIFLWLLGQTNPKQIKQCTLIAMTCSLNMTYFLDDPLFSILT